MPVSCVAYGCFNKGRAGGITYHSFPANEDLRRKWTIAVKRKDWQPTKSSKLCSAHFREEDFDRTSLSYVRLREGTIPSIFPAISEVKKRRTFKRKQEEPSQSQPQPSNVESPTKKLKIELLKTKSSLSIQKKKVKSLLQNKRRLKKRVCSLRDIIRSLKEKLNIQEEACSFLTSISQTSECLIKRSIGKNSNPKLRKTYDERLKAFAITLHFLSPKAYFFVRKTFNTALPHPRTLRRWYSSVNADPGFSTEVFRALKENSESSSNKPICSLMFDCMAIRKRLEWDGKRMHGTVNAGVTVNDDSAPMATEALVFHLVCINSSWKIPVGHFFVAGMSGDQLAGLVKQCLGLLSEAKIVVAGLTCDGTASNIAMANQLGCNIDATNLVSSFINPHTNEPIHFFLDPSHMIKLVRNTFGESKVLFDSDNNTVEWRYIEMLHSLQKKEGLHLGNKLSNIHINYTKQKMKVKFAVQVLSTSVADSLEYLLRNKVPGFENCAATIKFLRIFDKVFDILNSRSIRAKYDKQAMCPSNCKRISEFLEIAVNYISGLKYSNKAPILKSQRKTGFIGLLVCIKSTLALYNNYVMGEDKPLKYFPVYKISQDHLERLFGYIRSRGGHNNNPSCKQFTASFRRILLHRELEESDSGNTLVLNRTVILQLRSARDEIDEINSSTPDWKSLEADEDTISVNDLDEEEEHILNIVGSTSVVTQDILEYVAGYIVRSLCSKLKCIPCKNLLVSERPICEKDSLISCKNRGGLIQPSSGLTKLCLLSESVLKYFVATDTLLATKNVVDVMVSKVLNQCIGLNLFPDDHFLDQDPVENHFVLLTKLICKKFFTVRIHHYTKIHNDNLHKQKIRNHLTKTITFLGQ